MIKQEETFPIGYIAKHRGLVGEVEINFTDDAFDRGDAPYLLFRMDGLFVPFFWEEYRFKNDGTAIFKFEEINTEAEAKKFVGTTIHYPQKHLSDEEMNELSSLKALTGFHVETAEGKQLGIVEYVDDSSTNTLLSISDKDSNEILIPYHDDFLVAFDLKRRTLTLNLPEGLLNLNTSK